MSGGRLKVLQDMFKRVLLENVELKKEKRSLESKLFHSYEIIGKSQPIEKIRSLINKVKIYTNKKGESHKISSNYCIDSRNVSDVIYESLN